MLPAEDFAIGDDLAARLSALFNELLEAERQSIAGPDDARSSELRLFIEMREAELGDDDELDTLFGKRIVDLPEIDRPQGRVQESRMLADWESNLRSELAGWKAGWPNLKISQ